MFVLQKLASDIIYVAAYGDLHTNYEGIEQPPLLGKKWTAAVSRYCMKFDRKRRKMSLLGTSYISIRHSSRVTG
jgi:hypothetical protein